jgi:cytochrome P450
MNNDAIDLLTRHYADRRAEIAEKFRRHVAHRRDWNPGLPSRHLERELNEIVAAICAAAYPDESARILAHELTMDIVAEVLSVRSP